jgi:hypothetical protein
MRASAAAAYVCVCACRRRLRRRPATTNERRRTTTARFSPHRSHLVRPRRPSAYDEAASRSVRIAVTHCEGCGRSGIGVVPDGFSRCAACRAVPLPQPQPQQQPQRQQLEAWLHKQQQQALQYAPPQTQAPQMLGWKPQDGGPFRPAPAPLIAPPLMLPSGPPQHPGSGSTFVAAPTAPAHVVFRMPPRRREPMLLLDTTASMHLPTAADDPKPRKDTVREALDLLVRPLAEQDSAGGVVCISFADGRATLLGDLNPANFADTWASITWEGNTRIMPAWRALCSHYIAEFGALPLAQRPIALVAILTDGEALDIDEFGRALAPGALPEDIFVGIGIVGSGADHDNALRSFLVRMRLRSLVPFDARGAHARPADHERRRRCRAPSPAADRTALRAAPAAAQDHPAEQHRRGHARGRGRPLERAADRRRAARHVPALAVQRGRMALAPLRSPFGDLGRAHLRR